MYNNTCVQIALYYKLANTAIINHIFAPFRNDLKCGNFNGAIDAFSLNTDSLIEKYKNVELQLTFLQTEVKELPYP